MSPHAIADCRRRRGPAPRLPQKGSALLEALVAILIFSFGVLGLIGILAASIRATNDARYRAEAANLANAVIGDMWATAANELDPQFGTGGAKLTAWQNLVARELPSATGANAPSSISRSRGCRRKAAAWSSRCSGSCRARPPAIRC